MAIRRNLPINETYTLVDSFTTDSEDGCTCENCNKYITHVAVIKNSQRVTFHVGMDCAETLRGLDSSFEFNQVKANFAEAKAIRAKVNKFKKLNQVITAEYYFTGAFTIKANGGNIAYITDKDFAKKYLPEFIAIAANKHKADFTALKIEKELTGDVKSLRELYSTSQTETFGEFVATIKYGALKPFINSSGAAIANNGYIVSVEYKGSVIGSKDFFMVKDMYSHIENIINSFVFISIKY